MVALNSPHVSLPIDATQTIAMVNPTNMPRIESIDFSHRCAKSHFLELQSRHFATAIMGSGKTFQNASEFHDVVYLMSLAGRFRYIFKRNTSEHMFVVCTIEKCPWKITCRALSSANVVRVHTFHNVHNHSLDDVVSFQSSIRSNHASIVIDEFIRSTSDYQPHQICKDFVRYNGMRLSYSQAWHLKEKAKEIIYGIPNNYYKLLP